MTDRYLVVGNPIAHSRSPGIHRQFARATGQDIHYDRLLIEPGHFQAQARAFFASKGCGMNVTLPFKQEAFELADVLSEEASLAGAVNTLSLLDDQRIRGDNTDGVGLVRDLRDNAGWTLKGASILMLGAGGAVRGVLGPLLAEGPSRMVIANRTQSRADALVQAFADAVGQSGKLRAMAFGECNDQMFDLIINGTSASLTGDCPPIAPTLVGSSTRVYDMAYGTRPTVFMDWAIGLGAADVRDGLGMLVEQAAESFRIWRGIKPETRPVIESLRRDVTAG